MREPRDQRVVVRITIWNREENRVKARVAFLNESQVGDANQLVAAASLVSKRADEMSADLVLGIQRIAVHISVRHIRFGAPDFYGVVEHAAGHRVEPLGQKRIARITERRICRAKRKQNLAAHERRSEITGGGPTADVIAGEERRIAGGVSKQHLGNPVVGDADSSAYDELADRARAPREAKPRREIVVVGIGERAQEADL